MASTGVTPTVSSDGRELHPARNWPCDPMPRQDREKGCSVVGFPFGRPCLGFEDGTHRGGRVAEWLKAPDSKSGVRATVPGVQIPPLPPTPSDTTQRKFLIVRFLPDSSVPVPRDATRQRRGPESTKRAVRRCTVMHCSRAHPYQILYHGAGWWLQNRASRRVTLRSRKLRAFRGAASLPASLASRTEGSTGGKSAPPSSPARPATPSCPCNRMRSLGSHAKPSPWVWATPR